MSKAVKAMVAQELRNRFAGIDSACVVGLVGMKVVEQEKLRGSLREKDARLQVIKNALARRAFSDGPLEPLSKVLEGPCALVTTPSSLVEVAKILVEASKEFDQLQLKHAIIEGAPELVTIDQLSKMKSRLELIGEIAMLVSSPGRSIAGCLAGPQSKIAGCLKALAEKAA